MMKYIVVLRMGLELPIVFPTIINCIDMWNDVSLKDDKVVSAGFVKLFDGTIRTFGESESIGIKGRHPEDAALIEKVLKRG